MELTRRRFIGGAGTTLLGTGVLSNAGAAQEGVPAVTTFGHFDDNAELTDGNTETNYETSGDVPGTDTDSVSDLLVFVHGWRQDETDEEAREANREKFEEAETELGGSGYDGTAIGYEWDAHRGDSLDFGWADAKEIADRNGLKLAEFVREYHESEPDGDLRIMSHSLGTRVLFACLRELDGERRRDLSVTTIHPFGAAVDDDAPTTADEVTHDAIENRVGAAHNYHSREDEVFKWAYETREVGRALGRHGADEDHGIPTNYTDYDVTDEVGSDHSGYLENVSDLMVSHME
jgi:hypothetical protein